MLSVAVQLYQDVGELDVAMHDAVIVHMLNRLDDIPQYYFHFR